jgi:hypothetical protein
LANPILATKEDSSQKEPILNKKWFVVTQANAIRLNDDVITFLTASKRSGIKWQDCENYVYGKRDDKKCEEGETKAAKCK